MKSLNAEQVTTLRRVLSRYGVTEVKVFGSTARGEATSASDLDLLLDPVPGMTLVKLAALKQELEAALGRKVDLAFARSLPPRIAATVLHEARSL